MKLNLIKRYFLHRLSDKEPFFKEDLQKIIYLDPSWIFPRIELMDLLIKEKNYREAVYQFVNLKSTIEKNFPNPKNEDEEFFERSITGRLGVNKKKLINKYEKIFKAAEKPIRFSRSGTIRELTKDSAVGWKNRVKINQLDQIIKKTPHNIQAKLEKAFIYFDAHADGKALDILEDVIKIDPNCIDAYVWLAEIYIYGWAEYKKAKEILLKALEMDSGRADVCKLLADVYFDEGKYDLQEEYMKKALEIDPSWITPRVALIYKLISEKKWKEAQEKLDYAKSLAGKIKLPEDDMEQYYETLISGRAYTKDDSIFKDLEKNIKEKDSDVLGGIIELK